MSEPESSLAAVEDERAVPWINPGQFAWHCARYQLAVSFAAGKRVLDVGSGEGYGSAMLAETALDVLGVDYAAAAVHHAREKYVRPNLRFEVAEATQLSSELGRFDLITCLEVIEHVTDDGALLTGLASLLSPDGLLIVSTPNRLIDSLFEEFAGHEHCVYHINMLSPSEFRRRLRRHFRQVSLYGQACRGKRMYTTLKALDAFNLRHRFVRSTRLQDTIARGVGRRDVSNVRAEDFHFSRWLVRSAPQTVAIAACPR